MKNAIVLGAMLTLALLVTACGPAAPALTAVATQAQPLETAVVGTATGLAASTPTEAATSAATSAPEATGTTQANVPVTGATTIKATLSDTYGTILTDSNGVAVYAFAKDTQNGTTSACTDQECTAEWKPVTTEGAPVAGEGLMQNLLGTITGSDGKMQVTYNGWPLYYLISETSGGTTNGQGLENEWFLLSPSGDMIKQ